MLLKNSKWFTKFIRKYRNYYTVNSDKFEIKEVQVRQQLTKHIQSQIKAVGPISVAKYMKEVLTNPVAGYYMNNDVFGQTGDFITSPELGQIFGEIVGIWFLSEWEKAGSPKPFQIVELGPGRGSLCQDILRVFKHFNKLSDASVHLVEVSPLLSDIQARKLCLTSEPIKIEQTSDANKSSLYHKGITSNDIVVQWYRKLQDIPRQFSLYLAHEFFDALPIHKFQLTKDGWREILIDLESTASDTFRYVLSPKEPTPGIQLLLKKIKSNSSQIPNSSIGEQVEISLESVILMHHLAERIEEDGGIALIADYGQDKTPVDTFRAFKKHKLHDPLVEPGVADLTADVDFGLFKEIAIEKDKCVCYGPVTQCHFLISMGIAHRLHNLVEHATDEQKKALVQGYEMMTDPKQMGERFKLLSIFPHVLKSHLTKFPVGGFTVP